MIFLSRLLLVLLAVPVLAGPWLFGAFEPWWFWPPAAVIFLCTSLFGFTLTDVKALQAGHSERLTRRDLFPALMTAAVFLIYGFIRMLTATVYADAERGYLLALLPFFIACMTGFSVGPAGRRAAFYVLTINATALGLYGIINHHLTGGERVMWMPGYMQYIAEDRATGSYYCPNHFAGMLELGAALGLGLLLDRGVRRWAKCLPVLLLVVAVIGVILSKSRAGGLTLLALFVLAGLFGLAQYKPRVRWLVAAGMLAGTLLLAGLVAWRGGDYLARFKDYPWEDIRKSERVIMAEGALRAWKTEPAFGIGPGMHQNLWPHFAASPDGDREKGIWPSQPNPGWHSYEVHSDWVQLLEEYGAVGLVLFLIPLFLVIRLLWRGLRREAAVWRTANGAAPLHPRFFGAILAGFLAALAMILHEAVDFNLQMPATGWMLAAIVGLAVSESMRSSDSDQ